MPKEKRAKNHNFQPAHCSDFYQLFKNSSPAKRFSLFALLGTLFIYFAAEIAK
jgi:hypothetical protein